MKTSIATALMLLATANTIWAQGCEIAPPAPAPVAPPPPAPTAPAPAAPAAAAPRPATGSAPLVAYRPNQETTIDAYIGRVNAEPIFASDLFRAKEIDERL